MGHHYKPMGPMGILTGDHEGPVRLRSVRIAGPWVTHASPMVLQW